MQNLHLLKNIFFKKIPSIHLDLQMKMSRILLPVTNDVWKSTWKIIYEIMKKSRLLFKKYQIRILKGIKYFLGCLKAKIKK